MYPECLDEEEDGADYEPNHEENATTIGCFGETPNVVHSMMMMVVIVIPWLVVACVYWGSRGKKRMELSESQLLHSLCSPFLESWKPKRQKPSRTGAKSEC